MSAMLDTMVLVFASRKNAPQASGGRVALIQASKTLILSGETLLMSAVVLSEFTPMLKDAAARDRIKDITVAALTGEHVLLAAELAAKLGESKKLCGQCLSPKGTLKCPGCGNHVSQQYRLNDLHIAAAADCVSDVDTLYTFDKWLLEDVEPLLTRCKIKRPPSATGGLFEHVEAEQFAEVTQLPVKGKPKP